MLETNIAHIYGFCKIHCKLHFALFFLLISWKFISGAMGVGEMNKEVIDKVIKFLMMVILMGTIVIWIMMPTSTYKEIWLTSMRAKLGKSIYYGRPGNFTRYRSKIIYTNPLHIMVFLYYRSESFGLHVPDDSTGFSGMYLPSLEEINNC